MSNLSGKSPFKEITIEAVVIRADGTKEDLGVISYWHKNRLKRLLKYCHGHVRSRWRT